MTKIQSVGINKKNLIDLHQKILKEVLARGYLPSQEILDNLVSFSENHSKVIMFGVKELVDLEFKGKTDILSHFDNDYKGINEFIQKGSNNRNYKDFSNWLLQKLKFAEEFFIRAVEPNDPKEEEYILLLVALEEYLQKQYSGVLLPELEKVEKDLKTQIKSLYENNSLTEEEATNQAYTYLDNAQNKATELFTKDLQKDLNQKAVATALLALVVLSLEKPSEAELSKQTKAIEYQYLSNIGAFFFNSFRRVKETFTENIFNQTNKRSLATNQLETVQFNRNEFALSVLTHARSLFRSIIAKSSNAEYYKSLVPTFIISTLNPEGLTKKNLYLIKTKDEWSKTNGLANVNVVDGLGIHHGDQVYYKPVFDLEKELELSRYQRSTL